MAIQQIGYLGKIGPTFREWSARHGRYYLYQGMIKNGVMKLVVVQPMFAQNLAPNDSEYNHNNYTLGGYKDLEVIGYAPEYVEPSAGCNFSGYIKMKSIWPNYHVINQN